VNDPVDINKLSGSIAKAACAALVKLLDLLATAGLTKLGVRTTIHPDNVNITLIYRIYFIALRLYLMLNMHICVYI